MVRRILAIGILCATCLAIFVSPIQAENGRTKDDAVSVARKAFAAMFSRAATPPSVTKVDDKVIVFFEVKPETDDLKGKIVYNHMVAFQVEQGKVVAAQEIARLVESNDSVVLTDLLTGRTWTESVDVSLPSLPQPPAGSSEGDATVEAGCDQCIAWTTVEGHYDTDCLGWYGTACSLGLPSCLLGPIACWVPGYTYCSQTVHRDICPVE